MATVEEIVSFTNKTRQLQTEINNAKECKFGLEMIQALTPDDKILLMDAVISLTAMIRLIEEQIEAERGASEAEGKMPEEIPSATIIAKMDKEIAQKTDALNQLLQSRPPDVEKELN